MNLRLSGGQAVGRSGQFVLENLLQHECLHNHESTQHYLLSYSRWHAQCSQPLVIRAWSIFARRSFSCKLLIFADLQLHQLVFSNCPYHWICRDTIRQNFALTVELDYFLT